MIEDVREDPYSGSSVHEILPEDKRMVLSLSTTAGSYAQNRHLTQDRNPQKPLLACVEPQKERKALKAITRYLFLQVESCFRSMENCCSRPKPAPYLDQSILEVRALDMLYIA